MFKPGRIIRGCPSAKTTAGIVLSFFATFDAEAQNPYDLLPDMTVMRGYLDDTSVVTDVEPGRLHLRLSNATANIGDGPLFVTRVPSKQDELREDILQRVSRSDGSTYDRLAGSYVYHPEHGHVHVGGWALYRLREIVGTDGIGDIVAEGEKTSFCLWDVLPNDLTLPNAPQFREFTECNFGVQGISVGWADLYDKTLPDQWIDITEVSAGEYWLESEVDPDDAFLELDESNNIVRARVTIPPGLTGCSAWHNSASNAGQGELFFLFGVPAGLYYRRLVHARSRRGPDELLEARGGCGGAVPDRHARIGAGTEFAGGGIGGGRRTVAGRSRRARRGHQTP